jgi:two-component system sensor histidine kinase UhpB
VRLHTRIGVVVATLAACLLALLVALWLHTTRNSVHEEVVAATRVSQQWLQALAGKGVFTAAEERDAQVLAIVRQVGRVRANMLEVWRRASDERVYAAPPSAYKAGRQAPSWFGALLSPGLAPVSMTIGGLRVILYPDPSRAVLDAWDELVTLAGWALLMSLTLLVGVQRALRDAMRPLGEISAALEQTGRGCFDRRLPAFPTAEFGNLALAFNGMADRLRAAMDENVRLRIEAEMAERLQNVIEAERRTIARELHDELAQGIASIGAFAGAIVQRTGDGTEANAAARHIVTVTGSVQQNVRGILQQLRRREPGGLNERLGSYLEQWRAQHASIIVDSRIDLGRRFLPEAVTQTALRIVQEGLSNVLRHTRARQVEVVVRQQADSLVLTICDDGGASDLALSPRAGEGYGLTGMRERIDLLGGTLEFWQPAGGGFALRAWLPVCAEGNQS